VGSKRGSATPTGCAPLLKVLLLRSALKKYASAQKLRVLLDCKDNLRKWGIGRSFLLNSPVEHLLLHRPS
jgi:hypothetical protein